MVQRFKYYAESIAAKSFLKAKMQSLNILLEDDVAIKCIELVEGPEIN